MQNSLAQKISRTLGTLCFLALCLIPLTAHAREAKENARIEHLISSIEKLSGAKFIRNGTEYNPDKAGAHLRMKLEKGGEKVKTAENFIDGIAAKSSTSGKPYQIRKPDGTLVTTSAYFYARLKEYDASKSAP
jgi:hypothetical protein